MHGYELLERLPELTGEEARADVGNLYRILRALEEEEIVRSEWSADPNYVKVFVRRLRQKLGDDAEHPRYILTEWGVGYRFVGPR